MKKKIVVLTIIALCLSTAVFAGAQSEKQQKVTLSYGYISPELTPDQNNETAFDYEFKEYLESASNGEIAVDLYPGGQLGSFPEMIQGVMKGSIDIALVNVIPLNNFYEESMIFGLPGVFADRNECTAILQGAWGQAFNEKMEKELGVKVLFHYSSGMRHFTNSRRELRVPEDARGLTFRTMESPVSIKMAEAIGAKAVPIASSEMYIAMQNRVVDGQENPITSIIQDLTYEVQKYLVLDGHFSSSMILLMNGKKYDALSAETKAMFDTAIERGWAVGSQVIERQEEEGIQFLQEKGMVVYEPTAAELERWHEAVAGPTHSYVRSQLGDELVDGLLQAVEEYRTGK